MIIAAISVCRMPRDPQPDWVHDYRRAVGARIRALRMEANRPQTWVCEATGVDRTTFQRIESGRSDPRLGDLALIADALDTSVAELTRSTSGRPPQ